ILYIVIQAFLYIFKLSFIDYLAENLKNLRIYCGFKTFEVADFLNLTSSAYGFYEIGRSIPPLAKLIKLTLLYGVTVEDLVRNPNELMAHIERERKLYMMQRDPQVLSAIIENKMLLQKVVEFK
ncbi:MAG: helix-turn-helix transcriptional regulator, partial [Lysinibacillus sp.]